MAFVKLVSTIMWEAQVIKHRGEDRIAVYFEQNLQLNARIKKLPNVKWSNTLKTWHLPVTAEKLIRFKVIFKDEKIAIFIRNLNPKPFCLKVIMKTALMKGVWHWYSKKDVYWQELKGTLI